MKQRLLLCLLMLMVSVGIVKAQSTGCEYPIEIVIPANEEVTVTFTSPSNGFNPSAPSYPYFENLTLTPTTNTNRSVKYKLPKEKSDWTAKIYTDGAPDTWGKIDIEISGKVTGVYVRKNQATDIGEDKAPLLKIVTGITISSSDTLNYLKLGKHQDVTDYFPNLTSLSIDENNLSILPVKTDKMTPSIGKITTTDVSLTDNARSFMLDATKLFASKLTQLKDVPSPNLSIKTLYKNGIAISEVKATKVESIYHFKDANGVYVDGEYTADIEITDGDWKGIVIGGVTLNVEPAQFTLNITGKDATKVSVKVDPEKTSYEKGNKITLTPTQAEGSAFAGFELVKGLEKADNYEEGNSYVYVFNGKDDAEIKVLSKAANAKVTFNTNTTEENGTLTVWYNNAKVTNGTSIPCGAEIKIVYQQTF